MKLVIEIQDDVAAKILESISEGELKAVVNSFMLGLAIGCIKSAGAGWENLTREIATRAAIAVELLK